MSHSVLSKKSGNILCRLALFTALVLLSACAQPTSQTTDFSSADVTITVLHTNDTHSAYGGNTDKGFICYAAMCEGGQGGYVRLDQAVRSVRETNPGAIFLDAGDIFQGTLFWTLHKERMPAVVVDRMGYQAIIAGNHEFDDGNATYLRYLAAIQTPMLAANLHFDPKPASSGADHLKPYIVLERGGYKIGIVGLVNPETPTLSSPNPEARFSDAKEALEKAVRELTTQNVHIIIALTHLGFENERRLARAVNGVDIYVGAHSHSYLSNTSDKAEGPYPVVEKTPDGTPVLVVTASTACAYLGKLDVGFDKKGIARAWQGEPILLDQETLRAMNAPDPDLKLAGVIDAFAAPVKSMMETQIATINAPGRNGMPLEDPSVLECRRVECLSGNIVADALRMVPFGETQIALLNGGAIRASLPGGAVTPGDVLGALPFQNTPVMTNMPGRLVVQALEHGVSTYGEGEGRFLQVSGLRYTFNPAKNPGSRVTKAEVRDGRGQWKPLNPNATYSVVSVDYLARGGDGFSMFSNLEWRERDKLMNDVLRTYLEQESTINISLQNRIGVQK